MTHPPTNASRLAAWPLAPILFAPVLFAPVLLALLPLVLCAPTTARAQEFSWAQGQPAVAMRPAATHWCYLTMVRGKFRGWGEKVRVNAVDGTWTLSGSSKQAGVAGRANCVAFAALRPAGATRMDSGFDARQWAGYEHGWWTGKSDCATNPIRAWWGDAATAVMALGGHLEAGGENIEVVQSNDASQPSWAYHRTCGRQAFAGVTSFFNGTPESGRLARFTGPGGTNLPAAAAGEFKARHGSGTIVMAPVDQAMCYFTYIGGGFHGGGEAASIFMQNGRWALRADSKSGAGVWARARCYLLDQSTG